MLRINSFGACLIVMMAVAAADHLRSGLVMPPGNKWWMNYTIDTTASRFQATVWCKTKGWLGMGLSYDAPSGHAKTDSLVAFVSDNGTQVLRDQYSVKKPQPPLDVTLGGNDDLNLLGMGSDADSMWVSFWRNLNTNDTISDIVIANRDVYVAWACGPDVPVLRNDSTIAYKMHPSGWFGAVQVNLFATNTSTPSTSTPVRSRPNRPTGSRPNGSPQNGQGGRRQRGAAPGSSDSGTGTSTGSGATPPPTAPKSGTGATAQLSWPLLVALMAGVGVALPAFFF